MVMRVHRPIRCPNQLDQLGHIRVYIYNDNVVSHDTQFVEVIRS